MDKIMESLVSGGIEKVLEGFHLSSKPEPQKPVFPPPDIPKDFVPKHEFSTPLPKPGMDIITQKDTFRMDASKRSHLLGEAPEVSEYRGVVTLLFKIVDILLSMHLLRLCSKDLCLI
jgi:hypothetical protein